MAEEDVIYNLNFRTDNATKSVRDIRQEIKALNVAMSEAGAKGDTVNFDKFKERIGILKMDMGDLNRTMRAADPGELLNGFTKMAQGAVGAFGAVTGAMSVFGVKSEDIQIIQQRSMAIIETMMGLEKARQLLIDSGARAENAGYIKTFANQVKKLFGYGAEVVAIEGVEAATVKVTVAQRIWNLVTKQNPIMWLITGVIALGTAIYALTKYFSDDTEEQKKNSAERLRVIENIYKQRDAIAAVEKELRDMRIKAMKDGYAKERAIIEENIKQEQERIRNAEIKKTLTKKQADEERTLALQIYNNALDKLNESYIQKDADKRKAAKDKIDAENKKKNDARIEEENKKVDDIIKGWDKQNEIDAENYNKEIDALITSWDDQNEIDAENYNKEIDDLIKSWEDQKAVQEKIDNWNKTAYKKEKDDINKKYDDMIVLAHGNAEMIIEINKERNEELLKADIEHYSNIATEAMNSVMKIGEALQYQTEMEVAQIENSDARWQKQQEDRMTILDRNTEIAKAKYGENSAEYIASLEAQKQADLEKIEHDKEVDAKKKELLKKNAKIQYELSLASITINAAAAAIKAWIDLPWYLAAIESAAIIVEGVTQYSKANAEYQKVMSMRSGGLIQGNNHENGGVIVNAEGGEGIVNARSMSNPKFAKIVSDINVAGGGAPMVSNSAISSNIGGTSVATIDPSVIEEIVNRISSIPVVVSEIDVTKTQRKVSVYETNSKI